MWVSLVRRVRFFFSLCFHFLRIVYALGVDCEFRCRYAIKTVSSYWLCVKMSTELCGWCNIEWINNAWKIMRERMERDGGWEARERKRERRKRGRRLKSPPRTKERKKLYFFLFFQYIHSTYTVRARLHFTHVRIQPRYLSNSSS